jgi:hypothetical protein
VDDIIKTVDIWKYVWPTETSSFTIGMVLPLGDRILESESFLKSADEIMILISGCVAGNGSSDTISYGRCGVKACEYLVVVRRECLWG